jgi:uncharacterized membrane protein
MVFPHSETLLILQTLLLAGAAYPCYLIGKNLLNQWGGLTFALLYLLYPALHGVNLFDFHELAFLPLTLFFAIYFLFEKRIFAFIIVSSIALMIKEDVALIIFMLTLFSLIKHNYKSQKEMTALLLFLVFCVFWLIISVFIIIPHFNPYGYGHIARYSFENGMVGVIQHELWLKIVYLFLLFAPLGFTPFAAPDFLVVSVPSFLEILLQIKIAYSIILQYSSLVIPIIFTAGILGTKNLIERFSLQSKQNILFSLLFSLGLVSCIFCTPAPISPISLYLHFSPCYCGYTIDTHVKTIDEALQMIPENASVSTQNNLAAHLSKRTDLYLDYIPDVAYILIDKKTAHLEKYANHEVVFPHDRYEMIFEKDDVSLYKRYDL